MNNNYKYLSYGMGLLTITIISRWGIGFATFAAPSSFIPYGILGPISFSIACILSFSLLIPIILSIRKKFDTDSLDQILKIKLSSSAYKLFMFILFIGTFASLIVISYSAAIVLTVLDIPFLIGCGLFIATGFLIYFLTRFSFAIQIDTVKVGLLFLTIIVLLINGYVIKGTESVYQGVRLYHPYIIYMNVHILPTLVMAFTFALFGHLIADRKTWDILLFRNHAKLKSGLFTSGIIWSTIPLSFMMITLAAIQNSSFTTSTSLFTRIFQLSDNTFMILVLLGIFIFIFIESFSTQVSTLFRIVSDIDLNIKFTNVWIMVLTTIGIPIALHVFQVDLLGLFFVFGTFFAATAPVVVWIFLSKRRVGIFPFIVAACSTLLGWTLMYLDYDLLHIIVSFFVSTIVMGGSYYVFEYKRDDVE